MRFNKIKFLLFTSALALVLLILFQVKWMLYSKDLIEEQFNQKVSMAMANAVEQAGRNCAAPPAQQRCGQIGNQLPGVQQQWLEELGLEDALMSSMSFYDIPLDYKASVIDEQTASADQGVYCCSMEPLNETDVVLGVTFSDKQEYVLEEMGFMAGTSILLLLLVCMTFALTLRALLRQKRLNEINVRFFSNMSHEYRTPLTNIKLALSMMKRKHQALEQDRFCGIIDHESGRLREQIDRVLQLAKMEDGEYQLDLQPIDLRQLILDIIKEMQLQIQGKKAEIVLDIGNASVPIEGDPFHLGNAFRNLIENALKYCKAQPKIQISLQEEAQGVKVCFQDNGIGIRKADQTLVFEKFQRVDTGNLHDQKGFGLGLSYVKMVIELHLGAIKIFSELNKGSQFTLFLPTKS